MNYIEYLYKRYSGYDFTELAKIQVKAELMKRSRNDGLRYLGDSYQTAINRILQTKDLVYIGKFGNLKRLLYEQKHIY